MSQMKSLEQSLKTGRQKIRRQRLYISIKDGGEVRNYQILWDKEWNSYPDTKELEKNGKKLAYVGLITTGVKDQMKEIAVVIFGYGTYGDQGYKIYHLFAEQYVKP